MIRHLFFSLFMGLVAKIVHSIGVHEPLWMKIEHPSDVAYLYRVRPAKDFGDYDRFNFRSVDLVPAEPIHACSKLLSNGNMLHGKMVLVKRGECSFLSKVYNVEMYGAIAVIIYNHKHEGPDEDVWIDMVGDGSDRQKFIGIPAFYLRGKDGDKISESLTKHNDNAVVTLPVNSTQFQIPLYQPPWDLW